MRQLSYLGGLMGGLAFMLAACGGATADLVETPVGAQPSPAVEMEDTRQNTVEPAAVEEKMPATVELPPAAENSATIEATSEGNEAAMAEELSEEMTEAVATVEQPPAPAEAAPEDAVPPAETVEPAAAATAEPIEAPPGPTDAQQQLLDRLTVKGTPPELHNDVWLNSEPLKLADLHGQVVIVEFWTYG